MEVIEHFIVGEGNFPNWFNNSLVKGRARVIRDIDTGELNGVTVFTVSGPVNGKIGDVVINTRSGVLVIPRDKAKKYLGGVV